MGNDTTLSADANSVHSPSPSAEPDDAPSAFVKFMRKIYRPLGFRKGYNFPLFVIFGGAMIGFVLSRLEYYSFDKIFATHAIPGDWYWFHAGHYRVGLLLHLATVLPAGFLAVFQFVPIIRHKLLMYHRIAGYVIILLVAISNASALAIARRAGGEGLDAQSYTGTTVLVTYIGLFMAVYNIKKKQIDQHRAWMLRTWFYVASIITLRLISFAAAAIVSKIGDYYYPTSCEQIIFTFGSPVPVRALYPMCFEPHGTNNGHVVAHVDYYSADPIQLGASIHITFGMAGWLALFLHAVGVEIYLKLTPREAERLRHVSYEKQLEAGYKNPGSAGLVLEKFGDADPWVPKSSRPSTDTK